MANKKSKIILTSVIIIIALLVIAKFLFFDFIRYSKQTSLSTIDSNSFLVLLKNKKPDYNDVILIDKPISDEKMLIRNIAKPGDLVEIKKSEVYVNKKLLNFDFELYEKYRINCFTKKSNKKLLNNYQIIDSLNVLGVYYLDLTKKTAQKLIDDTLFMVKKIIAPKDMGNKKIFPYSFKFRWNLDYFGPVKIPSKGDEIILNDRNFSLYRTTITIFENKVINNDENGNIYINGKKREKYKFEQDYYFVLNDFRSDLNDSRKWGFIPEKIIRATVLISF